MWARFRSLVGVDEIALAVGLMLITIVIWPLCGQTSLLAPGSALVWLGLPSRGAFLLRPPAKSKER